MSVYVRFSHDRLGGNSKVKTLTSEEPVAKKQQLKEIFKNIFTCKQIFVTRTDQLLYYCKEITYKHLMKA